MISSDWEKLVLSDISEYITDKIDSSRLNEKNYVSTENMVSNKGGLVNSESKPSGKVNRYLTGDILISNIRPYFKKIWFADREGGCSADVLILRGFSSVCPKFLYYTLMDDFFFGYSMKGSKGTKMPRGDKWHIMKYPVSVPPIKKQKAIANILSSLDDKIELNNKIIENLEELAQSLYKQWFLNFEFPNDNGEPYKSSGGEMVESDLGQIPKGWIIKNLLNIADYMNGIAVKKYAAKEDEKSLPVLKIKELGHGDCTTESDRCNFSVPEKYIVSKGDLIFSWSGTLLVDFWTGTKSILNQHLFKVTSSLYPRWFYYFWTEYHLEKFQNIAKGMATTLGHIKRTELEKSYVIVPDLIRLNEGTAQLEPMINQILILKIQNSKLRKLRDELLPKLMNGEIEVPIEE